jgi:hypothetical protein
MKTNAFILMTNKDYLIQYEKDYLTLRIFDSEEFAQNYKNSLIEQEVYRPSQIQVKEIPTREALDIAKDMIKANQVHDAFKDSSVRVCLTEINEDFDVTNETEIFNSKQPLN